MNKIEEKQIIDYKLTFKKLLNDKTQYFLEIKECVR